MSNSSSQLLPQDIPRDFWDVIVIGAGPAGSICGLWLARSGHRVLLLDKYRFPRHKACGDLIIPDAIAELEQAGLWDAVRERGKSMDTIRIFSPSRIDFGVDGRYLGMKRYDFDHMLFTAAIESGAVTAEGDVFKVESLPEKVRVHLNGTDEVLESRYAVIATGASVTLGEQLGMISRSEASAFALRYHLRSDVSLDEVVITYDYELLPGYAWIMPLPDNVYNVGCGVTINAGPDAVRNLRSQLSRFEESFPLAREIVGKGERISKTRGASLRYALEGNCALTHGRVVAAGEVIGTTFPFTGEGIGKAMHSGRLAADVISEALRSDDPDRLEKYQSEIVRQLKPAYRGYSVAQRWLSRPWLNDFMAGRIKGSRYLQDQARDVMAETGDPRRLYAPISILRSYFH